MTALLQATIGAEQGLVAPGHYMRGVARDVLMATGADIAFVTTTDLANSEIRSPGAGLSAGHRRQTIHTQRHMPCVVGALGGSSRHTTQLSAPEASTRRRT